MQEGAREIRSGASEFGAKHASRAGGFSGRANDRWRSSRAGHRRSGAVGPQGPLSACSWRVVCEAAVDVELGRRGPHEDVVGASLGPWETTSQEGMQQGAVTRAASVVKHGTGSAVSHRAAHVVCGVCRPCVWCGSRCPERWCGCVRAGTQWYVTGQRVYLCVCIYAR